ncbi:IPT/TIG domain-containing protein [Myxococcota bacterium]|nr:IPT/TIG domain-containing protein [Myxococcota bacterium]
MTRHSRLLLCAALIAGSACGDADRPGDQPEASTTFYALLGGEDGVHLYPPLAPTPTPTGPFDATLLPRLSVALEATTAAGDVRPVATFTQSSTPNLRLTPYEMYFVNVPAATFITDPSETYRFRVLLDRRELAFSDLSSQVFDVMSRYPALMIGVKVRIEARDVPVIAAVTPETAERGADGVTLTVTGSGFASDSVVRLDGVDLETTKVSNAMLTAVVPDTLLLVAGDFDVVVVTPEPGGGTSNAATFSVVESVGVDSYTHLDFFTVAEGGITDNYQVTDLAVDWDRDRAYFVRSNSDPAVAVIRSFRLSTMVEDQQAPMSTITSVTPNNFPASLHSDGDGFIYVVPGSSNSRPIIKIDASSYTEVGRFGISSSGLSNTAGRVVATTRMAATADGHLITGSLFNDVAVLRRSDMGYVWGAGREVDESRLGGVVAGRPGEGWILGTNRGIGHTVVALYHLTIAPGASYDPVTGISTGVVMTRVASFAPSDVAAGATGFYDAAAGLQYDASDDSVIFQVRIANGSSAGDIHTLKWRAGSIAWNVVTPFMINYEGPFDAQNRLVGNRWTQMRGSRLIQLDTTTGATILDQELPFSEGGAQTYDAATNRLIVKTSSGWTMIQLRP